jgi:Zn-dependent protease with chaperone function
VLVAYDAYLCLQFFATIWAWALANLDIRLTILLSIADLSPPILSLYAYSTSQKRMRQVCNRRGKIMRPTVSAIFHECTRALGLGNQAKLWITNDDFSTAFAFGRSRSGTVVLTRGLVDDLSKDELSGVVSHELAHIKNGDHSVMTWASSLVGVYKFFLPGYVVLLFLIVWSDLALGIGNPVWSLVNSAIKISMIFVIPTMLVNYLSRAREYMADFVAYSMTQTYPLALLKVAANFDAVEGGEKLSLLSASGRGQSRGMFSTHPQLDDRIARMLAGRLPSFQRRDCAAIGAIVAISTIIMIEIVPSAIIYLFALIPSLFAESEQMAIRMSLTVTLSIFIERTIYVVEILAPALVLYFAIPNFGKDLRIRESVTRGFTTCVGLVIVFIYLIMPEQAITLGGPFPIPKRVWPAPPTSYLSLVYAASRYFVVLCAMSVIEWTIVPSTKSILNSPIELLRNKVPRNN